MTNQTNDLCDYENAFKVNIKIYSPHIHISKNARMTDKGLNYQIKKLKNNFINQKYIKKYNKGKYKK